MMGERVTCQHGPPWHATFVLVVSGHRPESARWHLPAGVKAQQAPARLARGQRVPQAVPPVGCCYVPAVIYLCRLRQRLWVNKMSFRNLHPHEEQMYEAHACPGTQPASPSLLAQHVAQAQRAVSKTKHEHRLAGLLPLACALLATSAC